MAAARSPRPENGAVGLTLLDAEYRVVVTGEERHQGALLRFQPGPDGNSRHVAVELRPTCVSYGQPSPGIEVLLNGQRVGELTRRMAQRYFPLIDEVLRAGGRPGCLARVLRGPRGIEVELKLPAGVLPSAGPVRGRSPHAPRPPASASSGRRKPLWIGVGAVVTLLFIGGSLGSLDDSSESSGTVAASARTSAATSGTSISATATSSTSVTPTPPTAEYSAPRRTTARVSVPPVTEQSEARRAPRSTTNRRSSSEAPPESGGDCDPNYSGCVPIASDVDCTGGSGNGPKYVSGPVRVTGSDVYGLDRDGNGIGCE